MDRVNRRDLHGINGVMDLFQDAGSKQTVRERHDRVTGRIAGFPAACERGGLTPICRM